MRLVQKEKSTACILFLFLQTIRSWHRSSELINVTEVLIRYNCMVLHKMQYSLQRNECVSSEILLCGCYRIFLTSFPVEVGHHTALKNLNSVWLLHEY